MPEDIAPKVKCTHPDLRSFTFADGKVISMCPACTDFDAARAKILQGK
jgi:hypothetical protein